MTEQMRARRRVREDVAAAGGGAGTQAFGVVLDELGVERDGGCGQDRVAGSRDEPPGSDSTAGEAQRGLDPGARHQFADEACAFGCAAGIAGAALSLFGVLSAVYGLKRAAQHGADPIGGVALAIGVCLLGAFLRRQHGRADPWIDLTLSRRRGFSMPLAANALSFFVLYGTQFFIAQYLQLVLGLSALRAGLWTIPSALGYLVGSALVPLVANRLRPAWLMSAALALTAIGVGLLTRVGPESGLPLVVTGSVVFSLGLAPVYVLTTEMTVASAPPERSGAASGVLETTANLGGALGIAFLGSLGGAVYRNAMTASGSLGISHQLWEDARLTLGGAIGTASRLPEPLAGELAGSARDAFTLAFCTVEAVGAGIMIVLAVATALLLRPTSTARASNERESRRRRR